MASSEIVLTPEGKKELEDELAYLEGEKRDEVGERIRVAREFGDISENSEFDDAKDEQARLEVRIAEIKETLAKAQVTSGPKRNTGRVTIGSVVTLLDEKGNEREFTIVGAAESDSRSGKISNECPLGIAILGKKKGEDVSYEGPTGRVMKFSILNVARAGAKKKK